MKIKLSLIISVTIICLGFTPTLFAANLRPSLTSQMKKQEVLDKVNYVKQRQSANLARLSQLKSKKIQALEIKNRAQQKSVTQKNTYLVPTLSISSAQKQNLTLTSPSKLDNIDINRVRSAWFGWYNSYRKSVGLDIYTHDARLDTTAHDWNLVFARGKGQNHHTRNPGDGYYNFAVIDSWFIARGIDPKVISRSKHTENVGYGYYSCNTSDCTNEIISSIRTTWNFFLSEKGKAYDAHYRSIINPHFTKMGFDIILVPEENRYYITIHFITE